METSWSITFSWDFDYPLFCQKFLPLPDNKERNIQSIHIGEQGDLSVTSCSIVFLILGNLPSLPCLIIEDVRIFFLTVPICFFCFYIYLDCKRAFYSFLRVMHMFSVLSIIFIHWTNTYVCCGAGSSILVGKSIPALRLTVLYLIAFWKLFPCFLLSYLPGLLHYIKIPLLFWPFPGSEMLSLFILP